MSLRRRTSWARVEGPELVLEIDPMDVQGQLKKKRGYVVMGKIRGCSPTEDHQACRSTRNRQPLGSKEQFEGDRGLRGCHQEGSRRPSSGDASRDVLLPDKTPQ
jgi:hypothetical protein